jgi:hypothetical protein
MVFKQLLVAFRTAWPSLLNSTSFTVVRRIQHKRCFSESNFLFHFAAVTPDNFLLCVQTGDNIQRVMKSKSKRPQIRNIVGSDGITYPSVVSQPIPHNYTWDSSPLDWEYSIIYLSNFAYGMQTELFIVSSNLRNDRMGILARPIGGTAILHGARKNLNFVAPEVLLSGSGKIGTKSDVWMLGCSVSASFKFQGCL